MTQPPSTQSDSHFDPANGSQRVLWMGRFCAIVVTILMLVLLVRVFQLQAYTPERIAELVDSQYSSLQVEGRRGPIRDRLGRTLAVTRYAANVFVDPLMIEDFGTFSERVGHQLRIDPAEVEKRISEKFNSRFIVITPELDEDSKDSLDGFELAGLGSQKFLVREYPQGTLAAPVIGFVGRDSRGLEGLELRYEQKLRGQTGKLKYLRDSARRPLWVDHETYQPHADGQGLHLTIDSVIQRITESELTAACEKYEAEAGMVVVMDPATGEILAMANYPTYDLNAFGSVPPDQRRNRCVTDFFEPGSTFKPYIWAMAIEGGHTTPSEVFDVHNGLYISPKGRRLRDAHPYDKLTWEEVLAKSSNIGMAKVGQRMGNKALHDAVRLFGFGSSTGSGLPGEVGGLVNKYPQNWTHYSETSIPMGQEIAVTALQMVRAFCVFGNDGLLVKPRIEMPSPAEPDATAFRIYERVLATDTVRKTRKAMRMVITDGTGRRHSNSEMYEIWGKSGTAQVAARNGRGYEPGAYNACFIAGAPMDNPRLVIGVFIHKPNPAIGYYGGQVSGPVVKNILEKSLLYMGVTPDNAGESTAMSQSP